MEIGKRGEEGEPSPGIGGTRMKGWEDEKFEDKSTSSRAELRKRVYMDTGGEFAFPYPRAGDAVWEGGMQVKVNACVI